MGLKELLIWLGTELLYLFADVIDIATGLECDASQRAVWVYFQSNAGSL